MNVSPENIINSWKKIIPKQMDTYSAMRLDLSHVTGDTYTEEDIIQFISNCEEDEGRSPEEEVEEAQEGEGNQEDEDTGEQEKKREALPYLLEQLDHYVSQETPVVRNMFKVLKNHFLGNVNINYMGKYIIL